MSRHEVDETYSVTFVRPYDRHSLATFVCLGPYIANYTCYSNDTSHVDVSWVVFHGAHFDLNFTHHRLLLNFWVTSISCKVHYGIVMILHMYVHNLQMDKH